MQKRRKDCESEENLRSGCAGRAGRCGQRLRRASNGLCAGLSGRSGCRATGAAGGANGDQRAAPRPSAHDGSDPGAAAAAGGGCSRGARARLRLGARLLGLARRLGMGEGRVCDSAQAPCGMGGRALGKRPQRVDLVWRPLAVLAACAQLDQPVSAPLAAPSRAKAGAPTHHRQRRCPHRLRTRQETRGAHFAGVNAVSPLETGAPVPGKNGRESPLGSLVLRCSLVWRGAAPAPTDGKAARG